MSSDYRPRGGNSSSGGGGGQRRRRGGRGRGGHQGEGRSSYSNGNGSYTSSPKKPTGFWATIKSWFSPKKSGSSSSPARSTTPRPDYKAREPRAERDERPRQDTRPPKAEPTPQEIVSPKLYVGNLSYEAGESDLFDLFSKVGAVKNVEIAMDHRSNRSKGFGFVEMETLDTAKEAAEKYNRTDFLGRQIVVSGAKVDRRPQSSPTSESTEATPETGSESTI